MPPKATGGKAKRTATATTSSSEEVAPANTTTSNDNNEAAGSIVTTSSAPASTDSGPVTGSAEAGPSQLTSSTGVSTRSSARRTNATHEQDNEKSETRKNGQPDKKDSESDTEGSEYGRKGPGRKKRRRKKADKKKAHEEDTDEKDMWPVDYIERECIEEGVKKYQVRWKSTWVEVTDENINPELMNDWEETKKSPEKVVMLENGELVLVSALTPEESEQLKTSSSAGYSSRRLTADEEAADGGDQSVPEQQEEIGDTAHEAGQDSDGDQPETDQEEIDKVAETPGPYTPPTIEDMEKHRCMSKERWLKLRTSLDEKKLALGSSERAFAWFRLFEKDIQAELEYQLFTPSQLSAHHDTGVRYIFPRHTYLASDEYTLSMLGPIEIPEEACRTDLRNDSGHSPVPEKEVVLTIMPNPHQEGTNTGDICCGSLCIRGLENLQPLDSSSARRRPPLESLMKMLAEALTSQTRICNYRELWKGTEAGPVVQDKIYYKVVFQAKEARFTPEGGIEWYQAKRVKPAPPGGPSNVNNSKTQAETNEDGANATGAGEDGNGHAEAMEPDESDAVMHDASGRNSAERSESAMDVDVDAGSSALSRKAESQGEAAPTNTTPTPTLSKGKGKGKGKEKEKGKEPEQASGVPSGTVASDQTAAAPTTPAATSTAKRGASTGRRRGRRGKK
ncbi:hypothetical protein V8F06_011765 [Rhypophila decipiens]